QDSRSPRPTAIPGRGSSARGLLCSRDRRGSRRILTMIIVLKSGTSEADVADVERRIRAMGYTPHTIHGELRNVIGAIGDDRGKERLRALESLECVESVTPILQPFKLASREVKRASTEVMEPDKVDVVAEHSDILQIGARNVQNFSLLRRVGEAGKPVLLKRGMSTSIQEWLLSAEYVLAGGNPNVILCERGIRTFETAT